MTTTTTVPATATPAPMESQPEARPRPRWERPALLVLLAATAVLYLWGLSASGDANTFYAAAVQAGTKSWKALFFGSFDSANFITVDKPPASLWVMGLSGRIFGFSSWSMLAPQALEGVAAVGLLYAAVRRWYGPIAGLAAGAILALTPVAVLMFRFNNPDALLTLLLVAAGYAMVRAIESASTRWLILAGVAIGFGFLTKMLQAFLVLPAFALAYLLAAPTPLRRRLPQLLAGLAAIVASAGWWVAIAELWPASSRPYIGGSNTNSVLELAFGYNGLGRITGNENGGPGGGGGGPGGGLGGGNVGFGGASGVWRLFGDSMGTQISWLLPAALIALVAVVWLTRRAPRVDRTRASMLLWGGWLLVMGLVFSYMQGTIHPYYTIALAPAIGALVAIGGTVLWRRRHTWFGRGGLALMVAATGVWSFVLLNRTPAWHTEVRYATLILATLAAVGLVVGVVRLRRVAVVAGAAAVISALLGTSAFALDTAATPHSGAIPTAGPTAAGGGMGGGPGGFGGNRFSDNGEFLGGSEFPGSGQSTGSGGLSSGGGQLPSGGEFEPGGQTGADGSQLGTGPSGGGAGGMDGATANSSLVSLLRATDTTWAAATVGSTSAGSLELASGKAIMAIGGFTGSDPAPTLAQFEKYVATGKVRYFIGGGGMGGMGGGGGGGAGGDRGGSDIASWVAAHYTATTVGGQTVYDLARSGTS